jgi:hypothetical protein
MKHGQGGIMRNRQYGVTLSGLLVVSVIIIFLMLLGFRLAPAYIEYFTAKKAIVAVAQEKQGASVSDIRKAFDARAVIDDITAVTANDLAITKDGLGVVIGFGYRKEVPLFANIGIFIDFEASSSDR